MPLKLILEYNVLHSIKVKHARTIDNRRELKIVLKLESFFDIISETVTTYLTAYTILCFES